MTVCTIDNGRFTSKDILIQYLPCGAVGDHVQVLGFHAGVSAGTFKLRVNGYETAAITFSATIATLLTSINAALDALPNLGAGDITATGTLVTAVTLTSDPGLGYFKIDISDMSALTGNTSDEPNISSEVTTQGSKLYTLSAQISKFSYEVTVDVVDVTAISENEVTEIPVKEKMTFDLSLFRATEDWNVAVQPGLRGIIYVYEQGKFTGRKWFAFWALFDKASISFPDHEVVEADMSGVRQGAMVIPFDSVYA